MRFSGFSRPLRHLGKESDRFRWWAQVPEDVESTYDTHCHIQRETGCEGRRGPWGLIPPQGALLGM